MGRNHAIEAPAYGRKLNWDIKRGLQCSVTQTIRMRIMNSEQSDSVYICPNGRVPNVCRSRFLFLNYFSSVRNPAMHCIACASSAGQIISPLQKSKQICIITVSSIAKYAAG